MGRPIKRILPLILVTLLALAPTEIKGAGSFTPQKAESISELWRWTHIEDLREWSLSSGDIDGNGSIWLSVFDGVIRYDGIEVIHYPFTSAQDIPQRPKDIHAAKNGLIYVLNEHELVALRSNSEWETLLKVNESEQQRTTSITETSDGTVWVSLKDGLYKINHKEAKATPCDLSSLTAIIADDQDRLWCIGNSPYELAVYQFDTATEELTLLRRENIGSFPENSVARLYKKPTGEVWAQISHGNRYFRTEFEYGSLPEAIQLPTQLDDTRFVHHFSSLSDGRLIFIQLPIMGIYQEGEWTTIRLGDYPIPAHSPRVVELSDDRILISGWKCRTFMIDLSEERWLTYKDLTFETDDLEGRSWFINRDKRVVMEDPSTNKWAIYYPSDGIINSPNSIYCDDQGVIWVSGSHKKQAAVSYLSDGKWKRYLFPEIGKSFSHLSVYQSSNGDMLFGIMPHRLNEDQRGGIVQFEQTSKGFEATIISPPQVPPSSRTMVEHSEFGKIFAYKHIHFKNASTHPGYQIEESFPDRWIDHLIVDNQNQLWAARWGSGLHRFDGKHWTRFTMDEGLAGPETVFIHDGKIQKGLWVATEQGLSRYDGTNWTTHALHPSFKFSQNAGTLFESKEGALWLNFTNRYHTQSASLPDQGITPTHYCIRYFADEDAPETELVRFTSTSDEPAHAFFSWTGKDPWNDTEKEELQYSYRLSGDNWSPYSNAKGTSLLDLPAGKYAMEVRARDRDWNVDTSPAKVYFEVVLPLWKRPWYIASCSLVIILLIALIATIIRQRMNHLVAIREFKIDFFTNLSHELRTPLTVILGSSERMNEDARDPKEKNKLKMITRNARKMLGLINQLLDLRKVELGKLKYDPTPGEVVGFIRDAVSSLAPLWNKKEQAVEVAANQEAFRCGFDPDKLVRIIDNLLSNAIKYTPQQGKISVDIQIEENPDPTLYLRFKDNGIGIPEEKQSQVLDPFFRASNHPKEEVGSGIGLSLVKELVDLWGGKMEIQSPPKGEEKGTLLELTLPLEAASKVDPSHATKSEAQLEGSASSKNDISERPKVLLVEDNDDLRAYLEEELSKNFQVSVATDGQDGLDSATQNPPDLIVSDVMMPEMDGMEFCRKIRANRDTCHIPLILLTARNSEEHYLEGIDSGADEYFSKPIKTSKLIVRIESLLKSRHQLYDVFANQIQIEPKQIAVVSADQKFLEQALQVAEENMQAEKFDIQIFARQMAISRTSLSRKIKALTGLTPIEFMRSMRMKRAAQLLVSTDLTVSEILPYCGMNDPSHFSRTFKKEFGMSPSEYRSREKK